MSHIERIVDRSTFKALWILCLLGLAASGGWSGNALAHGLGHGHGAEAPPPSHAAAASPRESHGAARAVVHVPDAGGLRAETPSHCPDEPFGGCCCGRAVLLHHVALAAEGHRDAFVYAPRVHDVPVPVRDCAYRSAYFLISAPPRAPPSPVAV